MLGVTLCETIGVNLLCANVTPFLVVINIDYINALLPFAIIIR